MTYRVSNGLIFGTNVRVIGNGNDINGYNAVVEGDGNVVHGNGANVFGCHNKVSGMDVVVACDHNTVTGLNARVSGNNNKVEGMNAKVVGDFNTVSGLNAVAFGNNNIVNGVNSVSIPRDREAITGHDMTRDDNGNHLPRSIFGSKTSADPVCTLTVFPAESADEPIVWATDKECLACRKNKRVVYTDTCGHSAGCVTCCRRLIDDGCTSMSGWHLCPVCSEEVNKFIKQLIDY